MYFAASKNLKLKTKKFIVGSEVEFGRSVLTVEKVKNQDRIFIAPKGKVSRRWRSFVDLQIKETAQWHALWFAVMEPNNCLGDTFDKKSNSVEGVFHLDRRNAKRIRSC